MLVPILMAIGCPLTVTISDCPTDAVDVGTVVTLGVATSFGQGVPTWDTSATNGTVGDGTTAAPTVTPTGGDIVVTVDATDDSGDTVSDTCEISVNTPACTDDAGCDDGDACNGAETCDTVTGTCAAGTAVVCADGEACVDGACVSTCTDDADCDDGDACTTNTCTDGACVDGTVDCDDSDACTTDTCDAATGCANDAVDCDDSVDCTDDSCDTLTGCANVDNCAGSLTCNTVTGACEGACADDTDCDDGLFCNGVETCDVTDPDNPVCADGTDPCAAIDCGGDTPDCAEGDTAAVCSCPPTECFNFTLASDNLTGTTGDDNFCAPLQFTELGGQTETLQTGDQANGLAGNDTLDAIVNGGTTTPTIDGIETINFSVFDAAHIINGQNIAGATILSTVSSTNTLTVNGLQEGTNLGVTDVTGIAGGVDIINVDYASAVTSGTGESLSLAVSGTTDGDVTIVTAGSSGFETLDVSSSGDVANTINAIVHADISLETMNFAGTQDLQVKTIPASVDTIDASGMSGGLTLGDGTRASGASTYATMNTVDLDNLTGGSGDDEFIFAGTFTGDDASTSGEAIDGGAGTDIVQMSLTGSIGTALPFVNIEELRLNTTGAATLLFTGVTGLQTLTIDALATSDLLTLTNVADTPALDFRGNGLAGAQTFDSVTYTATGVSGSGDTLALTIGNRSTAVGTSVANTVGGTITANGFEIYNITASDGDAVFSGMTGSTLATFTATANADLTMGTVVSTGGASNQILSVDCTGVTGDFSGTFPDMGDGAVISLGGGDDTFDTTGSGGTGSSITGGAGDDVLTGAAGADVIDGGADDDTLVGAAGDDNISGGAGDDVITGGTGADTITGGADTDSFVVATGDTGITLATADTITDFTTADDIITTSLAAGEVTIADGSGLADFTAFVAAADAVLAAGGTVDNAYMAYDAAGTGNGWLVIDEDDSGAVNAGDTLIILTGVDLVTEFVLADIG